MSNSFEMRLPVDVYGIQDLSYHWNEKQRLEVIKALIYGARDNHSMYAKTIKVLNSDAFKECLD